MASNVDPYRGNAPRFLLARHGQTNYNKEGRVQGTLDDSVLTLDGISQASALGVSLARHLGHDANVARQRRRCTDSVVVASVDLEGGGDSSVNKRRRLDNDGDDDGGNVNENGCGGDRSPPQNVVTRTWCSPMQRCRQTYAAASGSWRAVASDDSVLPSPVVRPDLREIELKEWEGRMRSEVMQNDASRWKLFMSNAKEVRMANDFMPLVDCWERGAGNWKAIRSAEVATVDQNVEECEGKINHMGNERPDVVFIMCHGAIGQCMLLQALGLDTSLYGKTRHYAFDNCECVEVEWPDGEDVARRWRRVHPEVTEWTSSEAAKKTSTGLISAR